MEKRWLSLEVNLPLLGIIALLLFIPLYPKFPLFSVPGTYVAIRIEDFLVALALFVWALTQIRQKFSFLKERVVKFIFLYWGIGLLSLISAILVTKNIVPHLAFLHWLRRVEYMALFFVAMTAIRRQENLRSLGLTITLATIGVIIYGLGQKFWGWPVVSTMNEEFSKGLLLQLSEWTRINSTFAGHYDLAAYLVMVLALMAALVVSFREIWWKIVFLIAGIFSFYLLILTASRVSFAAYLIAITITLFFLKRKIFILPVLLLSLAGMSFSTDLNQRFSSFFKLDFGFFIGQVRLLEKREVGRIPVVSPLPTPAAVAVIKKGKKATISPPATHTPTPIYRLVEEQWPVEPVELAAERSGAIRFNVEWPRSFRAFLKNPLLGTGYSSVTLATDNDYLRLLAETGILGFFSFALIFGEIGRRVLVFLQRRGDSFGKMVAIGLLGGAIGLMANATFIDVFESSKVAFVFWMLMGILVGITKLPESKGGGVKLIHLEGVPR